MGEWRLEIVGCRFDEDMGGERRGYGSCCLEWKMAVCRADYLLEKEKKTEKTLGLEEKARDRDVVLVLLLLLMLCWKNFEGEKSKVGTHQVLQLVTVEV
jgi:hypothetical protein